jgi:ParB family transcriptional regulator, chromosome partitioning protein
MTDINKPENTQGSSNDSKIKMRTGSGYLKQLYSTARTTASSTHNNLKNLTTFLVNFVPVDKVDASELQVRTHFDDKEIEGLAHSIKEHGVLQPILVVQDGDRYKVIAGERRLRASKLAGMDRIPARVITNTDKATHEIALRENLDRVDLHPVEEGEAYLSLLEVKAYSSYEAIAKAFGKPKSRITECIGFTRLPAETKIGIMNRGLKQRSMLRDLLASDPERHPDIIEEYVKRGNDVELNDSSLQSGAEKTESAASPKVAKEPKPFEYKWDDKGLLVPAFRWKLGEGPTKLSTYRATLMTLIEEIDKKDNQVII